MSKDCTGKDISNDTQIKVIDSMEPEIFTKMLRNLSEKLVAKFRATGLCDSRVKIAPLVDATIDFQPFWESTWLFILLPTTGRSMVRSACP